MSASWVQAVIAAGAVPAAYVPEASGGRADLEEFTGAEPVEDPELRVHPLRGVAPLAPEAALFLDGIERWRVVAYGGVTPIIRAHVAAAVRRRGPDRRPRTLCESAREVVVTRLDALAPPLRAALGAGGMAVVEFAAEDAGQPARALQAARREVERARLAVEQALAERCAAELGDDEWLVVDGVLSDSAALSEHPRTLGVIKSHGAQYFQGGELERALTLPAGHRTSVFQPRRRGARREIHSWYLRLWPWEGNDLLYGLLRVEARAHPDTTALAARVSAWLVEERTPLATPDRRWDRLLYPIHDVETYLRARAPRDLIPHPASRIPPPEDRIVIERRDPPPVGRVVATELKPATPHQFHFWTANETSIGIGAIVKVEGSGNGKGETGKVVYGVVTDGFAYSDLATPLHDVVGAEGDPARAAEAPTVRQEIRLWTAAVLRQIPEEPLQPVPLGQVHVATDADVAQALRMDTYLAGAHPTGIPLGLYTSGGLEAPVYLDADFLLGPEAAHLNISGVSGLATKTSAVEVLLASIFQRFPAHKGRVAAVCFNVKGPDLCFLDQAGTLDDADRRRYERLGLEARPFERVRYYAPCKADGVNLNTLRTHPDLVGDVEPLVWGLREVLDYAEVLLNRDDIDAKADAFIDFLSDRVVGREFDDGFGGTHAVTTFADLDRLFRAIFDGLELAGRSDMWRTHHIATMRKVRNRLGNISTRCKGLVTDDGPSNDLPWGRFDDRTVYVLDVANVDPLGQDLVFARVVSKLREHLERRDLGVDAVVVFVDELNKYAPADGPETYVKKMLLDISERGRYLGLVLFGAEQFRSQVHRRVVGNAGTIVFGRMDADELATPGYQVLSPATKIKLATLPIGELMVRHPHFTQPIFVRFPRPAVLRGRDGVERFPPAADLPFEDAVVRQLVRLEPRVRPNQVKDLIADRSAEDVRRALARTRQARPADPLAYFRRLLGSRVAPSEPAVREPVPPLDPIADEPY